MAHEITPAAFTIGAGDLFDGIDAALGLLELDRALGPVLAAVVYRGRIESVRRVKHDPINDRPGKAEITYRRDDGELEIIETGWLSDRVACEIARRAKAGIGRPALFWKKNDHDPTGKRAQGFRRAVWLVVEGAEAAT
jgi:hypothetical protein